MSQLKPLIRYRIIIEKLLSRPATFEEILEKLQTHDSESVFSKRTFQRDIRFIEDFYGFEIKFNRSENVYEIVSNAFDKAFFDKIFEAIDIMNALKFNQSKKKSAEFEPRTSKGTEHLSDLLYAIENRYQIEITYHKFNKKESTKRTIEPYLLKEFKGRWYVVAFALDKNDFRVFGLDRIKYIHSKNIHFQHPKKENISEIFKNCFGITTPNNKKPEKIKLLFNSKRGKYVETMPLHASQIISHKNEDEMLVELFLIPNTDFEMELLSFGEFVKVLEPQSLAEQLKKRLQNALKIYE